MKNVLVILTILVGVMSFEISTCPDVCSIPAKVEAKEHIQPIISTETIVKAVPEVKESPMYSVDDIELLALVTIAEAEGESEEGKRLVIDTILNRVDSDIFPDTIYDVVYQSGQFSSMWNGRASRVCVTEEVRELVREEIMIRSNRDVIYFTAGKYGQYGTPLFQVGNHYFASY